MWDSIFVLVNVVAMAAWAMLAFLPRKPIVMAMVLFFGVGLLCLAYVLLIVGMHAGIGVTMRLIGQALTHFLQHREQISQLVESLQPFLFPAIVAHRRAFLVEQTAPS